MTRIGVLVLSILLVPVLVQPAFAQAASRGRLMVTVADPSGAVIPDATVTVIGLDPSTKSATVAPAKTTDKGVAILEGLPIGRYSIQAEFPGFELGLLRDIRVRAGDNKHIVVLPIQKVQDSVTVSQDPQRAAADPRGRSFGTALTREQIEVLSDDPDEMQRQLEDMAGPGATIRIDSFEGGRLPPKAQIKAIHITRDAFSAENHFAGGIFIDIITQPGMGALRGNMNVRLRDGSMSGRSPFTPTKGPEQTRNFGGGLSGPLIKQKASFNAFFNGGTAYDTPVLKVALPGGNTRSEALNIRSPVNTVSASASFDYAVTKDQTLRIGFNRFRFSQRNRGVGGYNELERAHSNTENFGTLRIQEAGPLGRRFFTNTRLELTWLDSESRSVVEAPTIIVTDAFTRGGAQVSGGRHSKTVNLASDLDYVRGIHSVRAGTVLNGTWYRSDDSSNYIGTYTFESLAAFEQGRPRTYMRRIGDPNITYSNLQAGFYLQDDIRVRRSLTLSPGLRYEAQTHLHDYWNLGPRFGMTWSPFKSGRTTLRTSFGVFHDWLNTNTYEQTLRVDGFRQQEINIVNPSYPDPGPLGVIPPITRYLLGGDLEMVRSARVSLGIDQTISPKLRVSATYAVARSAGNLRGDNLNAPVGGLRPDPAFANIIEVVSDAATRSQTLSMNVSLNLAASAARPAVGGVDALRMAVVGAVAPPPPPPPGGAAAGRPGSQPFFNWRRLTLSGGYTFNRARNNTDGPFSVPPTGDLGQEWGSTLGDIRHRLNAFIASQQIRNLNAGISLNGSSAAPYTIRTGFDDNADLIFNDRPVGVARNTERARGVFNMSANFSYVFSFGGRTVALPPGIRIIGGGAGPVSVETVAQPDAKRYRLSFNVNIQNLTNHRNYSGFSGTMTSPFFGQPTNVTGMRKVDMGLNFSF